MATSIIDDTMALSDQDLLDRIAALAGRERETTVELVAHLAVLELRPNLYRAQGYGSLFRYCTGALHLSEDAACNRTKVTRACREFPMILDLLAAGTVSLTTVRMLAPHLTAANHQAVLARAANRSRDEIEALVAELAPQPDIIASVRKLPTRKEESLVPPGVALVARAETAIASPELEPEPGVPGKTAASDETATPQPGEGLPDEDRDSGWTLRPPARPVVRASAPGRYRVQFTIDWETYEELQQVRALLRREIPSGDPGLIFGRAIRSLRREVEKAKRAAAGSGRRGAEAPGQDAVQGPTYEMRIRPRTDDETGSAVIGSTRTHDEAPGREHAGSVPNAGVEEAVQSQGDGDRRPHSRHVPNAVKRAVWRRDGGQCAFVSADGRRCEERAYLELHHIHPYALDGPATAGNIAVRCRGHNQYESELIFGPYGASRVREADQQPYGSPCRTTCGST